MTDLLAAGKVACFAICKHAFPKRCPLAMSPALQTRGMIEVQRTTPCKWHSMVQANTCITRGVHNCQRNQKQTAERSHHCHEAPSACAKQRPALFWLCGFGSECQIDVIAVTKDFWNVCLTQIGMDSSDIFLRNPHARWLPLGLLLRCQLLHL